MDLGFTQEQEMLRTSAHAFLTAECPPETVKLLNADEKGYKPEMWKKMSELGWQGLAIPEAYGGMGMTFLDMAVLFEEMGKVAFPGPFLPSVVLGGFTLLEGGSEEQKKTYLPKISSGEAIFTVAITEPSVSYDPADMTVKATASGDEYVIDGTKLFVNDANVADYIIVVARTKADKTANGITLFLVDAKANGVKITVLKTIDGNKQCEVIFNKVRVPKANMIGEVNKGWAIVDKVLEKATVAKCAEMLGGAQAALDMSVAYAKERVQFGKPIGSFQAIQHHCANMLIDVESSRFLTYQAAWKVSEGMDASMEVSMAKAWVSDAYRRVTRLGHQIHGGIGFCLDHNMPLYFKHCKAAESLFGGPEWHREKVAQELGL